MKFCPSFYPLNTSVAILENLQLYKKNITARINASFIKRRREKSIVLLAKSSPENTVTDHFLTVILQQSKNVSSASLRSILTWQAVPSCKYHCLIWRVWSGAQTQAQEMAGFDSIKAAIFLPPSTILSLQPSGFQTEDLHSHMTEMKWDQVSLSLFLWSDTASQNCPESLAIHLLKI